MEAKFKQLVLPLQMLKISLEVLCTIQDTVVDRKMTSLPVECFYFVLC